MPRSVSRSASPLPDPPQPDASSEPASEPERRQAATDGIEDLSFREAQTALELCLAQLQDQQLDVELMADLYRRAMRYAERCETVLRQVEQQVLQWDPSDPQREPTPLVP